MKIIKYIWLLFVVALYIINYIWLKINIWAYTGIVLGILLILVIMINVIIKIKNRRGKTDDEFIFPVKVANTMKTIDIATQYEATILSIFFLMIGILLFLIYVIFLAPYTLIMKIFVGFNSICGLILMGSMLVTNYQQLMAHKESKKMLNVFANQFGTEILSPDAMNSQMNSEKLFESEKEKKEGIEDKKSKDYNPFIDNIERRTRD